ncbi:secreted protein [Streptomyces sp. Mg1]|nr:secreted protein [Streptomyces sp. Mg1]
MNVPGLAQLPPAPSRAPALTALRMLLALAVVFVMLAITGWTAVHRPEAGVAPRRAALASWAAARIDGHPLPPADAPVRTVKRFFAGLDGAQRARLADGHPLVVGNLDGAPATTRYRANLRSLAQAQQVEEARAADVALTPADRATALRRSHRFASLAEPGRQILSFDPTGGGLVSEVFGDLDRARRVSVIVPGVDSDLLTFERTQRRFTAPVGMAASLYEAERAAAPGTPTAVIAWGRLHLAHRGRRGRRHRPAGRGGRRTPGVADGRPARGRRRGPVLPQLRIGGLRGRRARPAPPGDRPGRGRQPGHARRERRRAEHLGARVGDAGLRRLDRGRTAPGARRSGPRGGPGGAGVRRTAALLGRSQDPHRLLPARYGFPGQLRQNRNRRVRFDRVRHRRRCLPPWNFRHGRGLTRVEVRRTGFVSRRTHRGASLYDGPYG